MLKVLSGLDLQSVFVLKKKPRKTPTFLEYYFQFCNFLHDELVQFNSCLIIFKCSRVHHTCIYEVIGVIPFLKGQCKLLKGLGIIRNYYYLFQL